MLDSRQRADLDRHITGNYGEDQFKRQARLKLVKWSGIWLEMATDKQLQKAYAQAASNALYIGESRRSVSRAFFWSKRAERVKEELGNRGVDLQ